MPKVKMTATKMSDAKVSYISLVERGANRIPFKIMKQENQAMAGAFKGLDLGALFVKKAAKPDCEVVGVVTMKGEGFDSVVAQIGEAGFAVDSTVDMQDGSVVLAQVDKADGEGELIRMGDHALLITKGFRPYSMDITSGEVSFADMVQAQGFYPGISTAMDVVRTIILSTAEKADDPIAASKSVGKVMDEFKTYVQSMISGLPAKAFKLESVFPEEAEVVKEEPAAAEPVVEADAAEPVVDATAEEPAAVVAKEEGEADPQVEGQTAEAQPAGLTEEQVSAIFATKLESLFETFTQKMDEALGTVQKGVQDSISVVSENVESLSNRVEKAEAETQAATKVLSEALVGGSEAEDHAPVQKTVATKSANREIDTAFMGKRPRTGQRR